uniref:Uncharacterized protein n=1 Tax=Panagrellus redivivus TaxID=6233 RepID=A0A7E4VNC8_PANRE
MIVLTHFLPISTNFESTVALNSTGRVISRYFCAVAIGLQTAIDDMKGKIDVGSDKNSKTTDVIGTWETIRKTSV